MLKSLQVPIVTLCQTKGKSHMAQQIHGSPPPPLRGRMDVVRCTTSERQEFVVISDFPYGQYVHWFGRRSHECTAESGQCAGCTDNWPRRWKAYLHVFLANRRDQAFLEITHEAYAMLEARLPQGETWRGAIIRIHRTKGGPRGRYLVEVMERRELDSALPDARDPIGILRHLWRAKKGTCVS